MPLRYSRSKPEVMVTVWARHKLDVFVFVFVVVVCNFDSYDLAA